MTFAEFVTAAEAITTDNSDAIFVRVEHKRFSHTPGIPVLEFSIWDAARAKHFYGADPETALANYRNAVSPAPVSETLTALGELPALPEEAL